MPGMGAIPGQGQGSFPFPGGESSPAPFAWPSCQRYVELPSGKTHFVEAGQGFPLVLVHGLLGYSFAWRKNIPALAERFRVLALDLAGCGYSEGLRKGSSGIEAWSRQVAEFLDALDLPQVHLLGLSAGGAVAVDWVSRHPDRVARLVLAAPVNPFSRRVLWLSRGYRWSGLPPAVLDLLRRNAPRFYPWLFRRRFYADPSRLTPETIPGYLEGLRNEATVPMLRQTILRWRPRPMVEQLRAITAPTLLIWGEQDKLVPPSCIPHLLRILPNARLARLPGAGHFCHEEVPDSFNAEVLRFLTEAAERP